MAALHQTPPATASVCAAIQRGGAAEQSDKGADIQARDDVKGNPWLSYNDASEDKGHSDYDTPHHKILSGQRAAGDVHQGGVRGSRLPAVKKGRQKRQRNDTTSNLELYDMFNAAANCATWTTDHGACGYDVGNPGDGSH